jgi:hypothetical protein
MRAFRLSVDNALLFYELCEELHANTEEERLQILNIFVQAGMVDQITDTPKTKEEYLAHLRKHFVVNDMTEGAIGSSDAPKGDIKDGREHSS